MVGLGRITSRLPTSIPLVYYSERKQVKVSLALCPRPQVGGEHGEGRDRQSPFAPPQKSSPCTNLASCSFIASRTAKSPVHVLSSRSRARIAAATATSPARRRLEALVRNADQQGERLRDLLRREVISEEDYLKDRSRLLLERKKLGDELARLADPSQLIEPLRSAILALNQAAKVFALGEPDERRALVEAVTWNLRLSDKKLSIVAKKPFALIGSWSSCPSLSG